MLVLVQLGLLSGFVWELEPLFYRPVRAEVLSLTYDTRLISGVRRRNSMGMGIPTKVRFPFVDYGYVVNGIQYQSSVISRHPYEEWRAKYTRPLRGRARGTIITAYVAPWASDRALLVRAPNFAILFMLTIASFFATILSVAARARR